VSKKTWCHKIPELVVTFCCLTFISSCSVGPDYKAPKVQSLKYQLPADSGLVKVDRASSDKNIVAWWESFKDPALHRILLEVASNNRDVAQVAAIVEVARAERRRSLGDFFPGVLPTLQHSETKLSAANAPGLPPAALKNGFERAALDFTWEIDVFGRLRRQYEASNARINKAQADVQNVLRLSVTEASENYIDYRKAQKQLTILIDTLENQKSSYKVVSSLVDLGERTVVEKEQASAELEAVRAQIPSVEFQISSIKERLKVLTGGFSGEIEKIIATSAPIPEFQGAVNVSDPKNLLKHRPDVVIAERELAATVADIGVAEGGLFPVFEFSGSIGYAAASFSDLGKSVAEVYSLVPRLSWALLDSGRIRSQIQRSEGLAKQALAKYEATVLKAIEEVQNSLGYFGAERKRFLSLQHVVANRKEVRRVFEARYREGAVTLTDVLQSKRDLLSAELQLEDSRAMMAKAVIDIYRAFGGGW
jgi:outer membrane protein, multidrug efflux system